MAQGVMVVSPVSDLIELKLLSKHRKKNASVTPGEILDLKRGGTPDERVVQLRGAVESLILRIFRARVDTSRSHL